MVSDFALCTLSEVKKWLNLSGSNATRDEFIEDLIEDSSYDIEDYCYREFVGRIRTEFYDGDGTGSLKLDQRPVNYLATLHDDPEREWDNADNVIERDDYMLYKSQGKIQLYDEESKFSFPDGGQNVMVEYHAGYSLLNVNLNRNDWIDFTFGTTSTSAMIPRDEYDCYTLASQIEHEMNEVAGGTYVNCGFDGKTNKFQLSTATSGIQTLSINFSSGSNSPYSMATTLGWAKSDLTGSTKYVCSTSCNPQIPRDLKRVCIKRVAQEFNLSDHGEGRQGIKTERLGDYSYTFADFLEMDRSAKRALDRYRDLSKLIG